MSARIYRKGKTRDVKNLKWFTRKAGKTVVQRISMVENPSGKSWVMEAEFEDGERFVTDYADLSVFKDAIERMRNVWGAPVVIEYDNGLTETFVAGEKRQSAKQRKKIDAALNEVARRL